MHTDDEFDGTTYIDHGSHGVTDESEVAESNNTPLVEHSVPPAAATRPTSLDDELETLEERVAKLEAELSKYEESNDKKLKSVEKLAKKNHVSPEERYYRIQEDS